MNINLHSSVGTNYYAIDISYGNVILRVHCVSLHGYMYPIAIIISNWTVLRIPKTVYVLQKFCWNHEHVSEFI